MVDTKNGGGNPANGGVALSQSGRTGASDSNDVATIVTVVKAYDSESYTAHEHPQYSIDPPVAQCYATMPGYAQWLTPEWQHTQDAPWCADMECHCHFQQWRMERYFIGPIERGVIGIAEAIDLYHAEPGYMQRKREAAREREGVLVG